MLDGVDTEAGWFVRQRDGIYLHTAGDNTGQSELRFYETASGTTSGLLYGISVADPVS